MLTRTVSILLLLTLTPTTAVTAQQAGGRFGGRRAGGPAQQALTEAMAWCSRQQQPDGGFVDAAGQPDLEGAALFALVCLGDGSSLKGGPHQPALRRCIDWLLARQHDDGSFEDLAPGSVRRQAQVAYALAEAAGLAQDTDTVRSAAVRALQWLFTRREQDGGWGLAPGTPTETEATAWSLLAIASAAFFGFDVDEKPAKLVEWFDGRDAKEPRAAAAELFCRYFAGQNPKTTQRMTRLAEQLVAKAELTDPHTTYWTSYALFQCGGRHWHGWSQRLVPALRETQIGDGEHKGSWEPPPGTSRLTATALQALSLEAYYRYTRLVR